jgi:hypothetical protein
MIFFLLFLCFSSIYAQECNIVDTVLVSGDVYASSCNVSLCQLPIYFFQPIFGSGSATCTIAVNTTLSTDLFCATLTVNTGITLFTNGYRIFVAGTFTLTGSLSNNGGNANITNAGVGAPGNSLGPGTSGGGPTAPSNQNGANGTSSTDVGIFSGQGVGGSGGVGETSGILGGLGGNIPFTSGAYTITSIYYMTTMRDLEGTLFGGGSGGGSGASGSNEGGPGYI